MARRKKIPQRGVWEMDVLPVPLPSADGAIRMGAITRRDDGAPLAMGPVNTTEQVRALLDMAVHEPICGDPPSRPKEVRVHPELVALAREPVRALSARCVQDVDLSAMQHLAELLSTMPFAVLGDVPRLLPMWHTVLPRLDLNELHVSFDTSIGFKLTGVPGCDALYFAVETSEMIPVVVVVFPNEQAWRDAVTDPMGSLTAANTLHLSWHKEEQVDPDRFEELEEAGLVSESDWAPMLYAQDDSGPRAVTGSEETRMLAVLACLADGLHNHPDTATGVPGSWSTKTLVGTVTVEVQRAEMPFLLEGIEHRLHVEPTLFETPELVLQLRDSDARDVAERFADVDLLDAAPRGQAIELRVWSEMVLLGVVARVPLDDSILEAIATRPALTLTIAGGGTSEHGYSDHDVVMQRELALPGKDFDLDAFMDLH